MADKSIMDKFTPFISNHLRGTAISLIVIAIVALVSVVMNFKAIKASWDEKATLDTEKRAVAVGHVATVSILLISGVLLLRALLSKK